MPAVCRTRKHAIQPVRWSGEIRSSPCFFAAFVELAASGRFRAAIDVYPEEPVPAASKIRSAPGIVYSAHLAGGIEDSYARIRDMMLDDIGQVLAGHPPLRMQRAEPRQAAVMRSR